MGAERAFDQEGAIRILLERERKQRECAHEHRRLPENDFDRLVRRYVECADCGMTLGNRMQRIVTLCPKCFEMPITKWYPVVKSFTVHNANFARIACPRCHDTFVLHSHLSFGEDDTPLDIYTEVEWAKLKEKRGWEDEDVEWTGDVPTEKFDHKKFIQWMRDKGQIDDKLYQQWLESRFDSQYDGTEF